uniref:Ribonuclease P/MRP 14 subunit n=3 Tax=Poecilia TaxID=8080 RepID=A0A087YAM4_POEFO
LDTAQQKMRAGAEEAESSGYQRVVLKNASPHHYLKVRLVLEDESARVSAIDLKTFITSCLRSLFGEVGAALNVDVLKYDEETLTALLRVPSRGLVKLWSSLTLQGFYQNRACAFRVLQVSPFLLALTGNSRDLQLD